MIKRNPLNTLLNDIKKFKDDGTSISSNNDNDFNTTKISVEELRKLRKPSSKLAKEILNKVLKQKNKV